MKIQKNIFFRLSALISVVQPEIVTPPVTQKTPEKGPAIHRHFVFFRRDQNLYRLPFFTLIAGRQASVNITQLKISDQ